jgi:hypothetical protein
VRAPHQAIVCQSYGQVVQEWETTYVKQKLALHAILGLLLEEDIAYRVDDQHFAILTHDASLSALGTGDEFCFLGRADISSASFLGNGGFLAVLALVLLPGTRLLAIPRNELGFLLFLFAVVKLLRVDRSSSGINARDALNGRLVAPSGLTCVANVALNEGPALLPAHVQSKVVDTTTDNNQNTEENRAEARTEAIVVVARALPGRKAIPQEVVVALTLRTLEDVCNNRQLLISGSDLLHVRVDFLLRWTLAGLDTRGLALLASLFSIIGDEDLARLVGVELAASRAVGFGQFVLVGTGLNAEHVIEGDIGTLRLDDFVAQTEDFVIYAVRCQLICIALAHIGRLCGDACMAQYAQGNYLLEISAVSGVTYPLSTRQQQRPRRCPAAGQIRQWTSWLLMLEGQTSSPSSRQIANFTSNGKVQWLVRQ